MRFQQFLVLERAVKRGVQLGLASQIRSLFRSIDREDGLQGNRLRVECGVRQRSLQ